MKLIQTLIFMLLIGYTVPSISADWYTIPNTDWQGDWSRIRVDNAGNISIWVKSVTPPDLIAKQRDRENYRDYQYSKAYFVVNCKQETYYVQQGVDYGAGGRVIDSWTNPIKFQVVTPESYGEALFQAVCPSPR